jgi:hypothetical protein
VLLPGGLWWGDVRIVPELLYEQVVGYGFCVWDEDPLKGKGEREVHNEMWMVPVDVTSVKVPVAVFGRGCLTLRGTMVLAQAYVGSDVGEKWMRRVDVDGSLVDVVVGVGTSVGKGKWHDVEWMDLPRMGGCMVERRKTCGMVVWVDEMVVGDTVGLMVEVAAGKAD